MYKETTAFIPRFCDFCFTFVKMSNVKTIKNFYKFAQINLILYFTAN